MESAVCIPDPTTLPHTGQTIFPFAIWLGGDPSGEWCDWLKASQAGRNRGWYVPGSQPGAWRGSNAPRRACMYLPNRWRRPSADGKRESFHSKHSFKALALSNWDLICGICFSLLCDLTWNKTNHACFPGALVVQWWRCWQKSLHGLNTRPWQPYSRSPPSPPTHCCPRTPPTKHGTLSAASLWRPNTGRVLRNCSDTPSPRSCAETCLVSELEPESSTVASAVSVASLKPTHDRRPDVDLAWMSVLNPLSLCHHADASNKSQCPFSQIQRRQLQSTQCLENQCKYMLIQTSPPGGNKTQIKFLVGSWSLSDTNMQMLALQFQHYWVIAHVPVVSS